MVQQGRRALGRQRVLLALLAVALVALHVGLTLHFVPLRGAFGGEFLYGDDFDLHIGQIKRVVEGLSEHGKSWVYDVKLLAGQPEGTISDSGSKGWELWTFALHQLGVSLPSACNSFVLLIMLAGPLCIFAAARLLGLSALASLLAAAMASTLWFFDSFFHWVWWVGMVSYAGAAYFSVLALALFYRFVERGGARYAGACALAVALVHLVHPYSFFVLAPPMAVLYARGLRSRPRAAHAAVLGIVALTLAVNGYWLRAAQLHWHYILDSAYYGQGGLRYLVGDFFNVLQNPADTGMIGVRTGFRFLYLGLAVAGLWALGRARDPRALPLTVALGVLLVLSYLGQYIPGAGQIQPYRNILPASMLACVLAASFVEWLAAQPLAIGASKGARALLCVGGLVIAQHLALDALYFLPRAIPDTQPLPDGTPSPMSKYGHLVALIDHPHVDYRLPHEDWLEPGLREVVSWVQANVEPGARILVDNTVLGERIAWKTDVQVMGGFLERNTDHAYANYFRRYPTVRVGRGELDRYLRAYAIRYVIDQHERSEFAAAFALLDPVHQIAGFRIYRTRPAVSQLLVGSRGRVLARTNRIEVQGSDPGEDLVLSYQFHEALRCEPNCRLVREPNRYAPVGFLRIPAPHPADFAVVNSYRLEPDPG